jgi:penicillin-binding protein 1A
VEEIRTLSGGGVVYNHDRDEPPRKQIFDPKVIGDLNTMLQAVVLEGTGKAAQLDYTYSAGKTGTSSAYRDAWFIGFTGQYVTGVWLGNDDFTPMARVTGGSFPAQTWKTYMVAAHDTDNIPQIAGLPVHPVQAAEQARIAAAVAQNAAANTEIAAPAPESVKDMSSTTRQVLEKLSSMLKDARPLTPSDARPDRAEAPVTPAAESQPKPSLASAANADDAPQPAPDTSPAPAEPQTALSAGSEDGAATPH